MGERVNIRRLALSAAERISLECVDLYAETKGMLDVTDIIVDAILEAIKQRDEMWAGATKENR